MSDKLDKLDYYTLLAVPDTATVPEIKRAFRAFARKFHPDRHADQPADKRERAARIYRRGSEGFEVLTDADERTRYDQLLREGRVRFTAEDRALVAARKNPVSRKQQHFKTPEAKAFYEKARQLVRDNAPRSAWKALHAALAVEPDNRHIKAALVRVEKLLR